MNRALIGFVWWFGFAGPSFSDVIIRDHVPWDIVQDSPVVEGQQIWKAAQGQMRSTVKPGIILVSSTEDMGERWRFLRWFDTRNPVRRRLLCEAVFACLTPEAAASLAGKDVERHVLVTDVTGKVRQIEPLPANGSNRQLDELVSLMLHGANNERLKMLAQQQRDVLTDEQKAILDRALSNLGADKFEERKNASEQIRQLAPRITAVMALAWIEATDPEVQTRLQEQFDRLYETSSRTQPGSRLPYGIPPTMSQFEEGECGWRE